MVLLNNLPIKTSKHFSFLFILQGPPLPQPQYGPVLGDSPDASLHANPSATCILASLPLSWSEFAKTFNVFYLKPQIYICILPQVSKVSSQVGIFVLNNNTVHVKYSWVVLTLETWKKPNYLLTIAVKEELVEHLLDELSSVDKYCSAKIK